MSISSQSSPRIRLCQLALDSAGIIIACDEDAGDKIGFPEREVKGRSLRELLLSINSRWEPRLPAELRHWPSRIYLPLEHGEARAAVGMAIDTLLAGDMHFVTVSPTLAPNAQLDQASVKDLPDDPGTTEQLFLKLRTVETRLNSYLNNFPGIFFSQRPDLSFSYIGPGLASVLGTDIKPLFRNGNRFLDLILPADRPKFLSDLERSGLSGNSFSFSYRMRHPAQGNIVYFLDVRTPRLSPTGLLLGYDGVWLDITRQSIAESRLSRSAWKENLATITSGLIHDFSNMMAGIYSLSELYHSSLDKEHPWHRGMSQIMDSARQARQLVRRIIDLNRETGGQANYHNLENLITEQLDLIRAIMTKQTRVETCLTGEELPVFLDEVSFRQLILNLAMNSRDAMDRNGHVQISTKRVATGDILFSDTPFGGWYAPREGVLICFKDNGNGISPEHLPRIFDPFFTTKEATKGSGFGLYNARLFISEARGRIAVKSRQGEGTSFQIYLPLADFTEGLEQDEQAGSDQPMQRPILAIHAGIDPTNFELVTRLHEKEWEVICFTRPEALRRYLREAPRKPSLMLSIALGADPISEQLLDEIREAHPDIKRAVLMIGRNPDEITEESRRDLDLLLDDSMMTDDLIRELDKLCG